MAHKDIFLQAEAMQQLYHATKYDLSFFDPSVLKCLLLSVYHLVYFISQILIHLCLTRATSHMLSMNVMLRMLLITDEVRVGLLSPICYTQRLRSYRVINSAKCSIASRCTVRMWNWHRPWSIPLMEFPGKVRVMLCTIKRWNSRCLMCASPCCNHQTVLALSHPVGPSLSQTLTEPAIFASETSCDCRAPHEKLTIAQARRGTPGRTPPSHLLQPVFSHFVVVLKQLNSSY